MRSAELAEALEVDDATAAVAALVERLGLPTRLSDVGVTDDDLDAVARLSQSNGNVRANPRPVGEDDALRHPRVGLLAGLSPVSVVRRCQWVRRPVAVDG